MGTANNGRGVVDCVGYGDRAGAYMLEIPDDLNQIDRSWRVCPPLQGLGAGSLWGDGPEGRSPGGIRAMIGRCGSVVGVDGAGTIKLLRVVVTVRGG